MDPDQRSNLIWVHTVCEASNILVDNKNIHCVIMGCKGYEM